MSDNNNPVPTRRRRVVVTANVYHGRTAGRFFGTYQTPRTRCEHGRIEAQVKIEQNRIEAELDRIAEVAKADPALAEKLFNQLTASHPELIAQALDAQRVEETKRENEARKAAFEYLKREREAEREQEQRELEAERLAECRIELEQLERECGHLLPSNWQELDPSVLLQQVRTAWDAYQLFEEDCWVEQDRKIGSKQAAVERSELALQREGRHACGMNAKPRGKARFDRRRFAPPPWRTW